MQPVSYLRDSRAIFIVFDRPSVGAEVGKFEPFVFLFLALFCGVLFLFFVTVIFLSFRNL